MSSEKIGPQHRARKAMLYVRQSSPYQVLHNRESQALQYAMRDRLAQLGWSEIEVVDEDLGRSAASGAPRASSAWSRKSASARSAPRWRFRASRATAATGSSWSRCAACSTPCSSTRIRAAVRQ
jgi:hypothetical protein